MSEPVDVAAIRVALECATEAPWFYTCNSLWHATDPLPIAEMEASDVAAQDNAELIVLLRNNAETLLASYERSAGDPTSVYHEAEELRRALDRAQAVSEGVVALRSAAEAWANVEVPDGRWSAGEIADWLNIKADLIEQGGDL